MGGLRTSGREHGVTLMELLVTIVIAAIFFAAMVPLFVAAQVQGSGDRARVIAANIAQSQIEDVRAMKFADIDSGTQTATWPNDEGGPVKTYSIETTTHFVYQVPGDATSPVIYKVVKVDVSWTPPPSPVKHIVFQTVVYPQYRGPEIVNFRVTDTAGATPSLFTRFPVTLTAQVNGIDYAQTDFVRLAARADDGSYSRYMDVPAAQATVDADGAHWFTWAWDGAGAGDGAYTFTAVAVSVTGRLGEVWTLHFPVDTGAPDPPTLTAATPGHNVVCVQWSPPDPVASDLASYTIVRSGGTGELTIDHLSTLSTTYIDRAATDGTTYTYQVFAVDDRGQTSQGSNTFSATPFQPNDTVAPPPPANLAWTVSGQSVTLTWTANAAVDGVTTYRVYRSDIGLSSPIAIIKLNGSASYSCTDPDIGWGVSGLIYSVRAVDAAQNEGAPATTTPVGTPGAPPQQPFGLTIKVTGSDAFVMVASLLTGYVYDITGQRIVDEKSVSPILVKSNWNHGQTFSNLSYSIYRITVTPVDKSRNPTGESVIRDVELVGDETITFSL